ncbi:helix-turn-helix domain-containing protein [Lactococcus lactis]|uniref:helix-turn-helix domain-containing protein n=1 Tax=Lactococcus lactis TaxID=1358 RepID=UPI0022E25BA2|nr:helix-turn-helix transcriptional regulator [Lactococcus lactis]
MSERTIFKERLQKLVEKSKKTTNQIERELGYPRNTLHNYKNGGEPSGIRLVELSEYFKVSPNYLIGKQNEPNSLPLEIYFHTLSMEEKCFLISLSQKWLLQQVKV